MKIMEKENENQNFIDDICGYPFIGDDPGFFAFTDAGELTMGWRSVATV